MRGGGSVFSGGVGTDVVVVGSVFPDGVGTDVGVVGVLLSPTIVGFTGLPYKRVHAS